MANKAISELPQALNVNNQDLFVLEQSGIAKKLTAETFITEQGIIDALAEALDGHGGISSVTLSSVSGRIRTYLITFTDETTTTFQVLDGTSIDRIVKTSTAGLTDTYTVFMTDGTTTFFTVTNGADGTVSEAMLNDALKDKAPAVTETTESSAIANFTDGADDLVMHNIVAEINPVQSGSGDPSPSNVRTISGWTGCNVTRTGKNLFDISLLARINNNVFRSSTFPLKAGSYIFSRPSADNGLYSWYVRSVQGSSFNNEATGGESVVSKTFTLTADSTMYIEFYKSSGIADNTIKNIQIELGSTATAYEPYIAPATVSLSWQDEAGTVYGGTVDVATGLLTVTEVLYQTKWKDGASATVLGNYTRKTFRSGFVANYPNYTRTPISNIAPYKANFTEDSLHFYVNATNGNNTIVFLPNDTDGETDIQICYEVATPQTYQLSEQQLMTLYGTNNVWADTGNVSVTYPADTKMYIENLTQPTEDDLVANQAITSGQYFMIGNSLYLALANIASGAQITIGTNAQRVSLADALNTINS